LNQNEQLRTFLLSNAKRLTEEWYDSLDKKMLPEFMLLMIPKLFKH